MSGINSGQVRVAANGSLKVIPLTTGVTPTWPTDTLTSWDSGFVDLGYISETGVTFTPSQQTKDVIALQSLMPVRRIIQGQTMILSASLEQLNTASLQAAFGGGTVSTTGSPSVACTFQDTGDTVTKSGHGLSAGQALQFLTVANTTGVTAGVTYYVVNPQPTTFQVALAAGGSPVALTTDGSGTYGTYVGTFTPPDPGSIYNFGVGFEFVDQGVTSRFLAFNCFPTLQSSAITFSRMDAIILPVSFAILAAPVSTANPLGRPWLIRDGSTAIS